MPRTLRPCPVPGCDRHLSKDNRVSFVCEEHRHAPGYCRCLRCMAPPKGQKPLRAWSGTPSDRHTVTGTVRGHVTFVTADTREEASSFFATLARVCA